MSTPVFFIDVGELLIINGFHLWREDATQDQRIYNVAIRSQLETGIDLVERSEVEIDQVVADYSICLRQQIEASLIRNVARLIRATMDFSSSYVAQNYTVNSIELMQKSICLNITNETQHKIDSVELFVQPGYVNDLKAADQPSILKSFVNILGLGQVGQTDRLVEVLRGFDLNKPNTFTILCQAQNLGEIM